MSYTRKIYQVHQDKLKENGLTKKQRHLYSTKPTKTQRILTCLRNGPKSVEELMKLLPGMSPDFIRNRLESSTEVDLTRSKVPIVRKRDDGKYELIVAEVSKNKKLVITAAKRTFD